ncbi:hypothetical protein pb186bvf_000251 [Paramecium bursaria]
MLSRYYFFLRKDFFSQKINLLKTIENLIFFILLEIFKQSNNLSLKIKLRKQNSTANYILLLPLLAYLYSINYN